MARFAPLVLLLLNGLLGSVDAADCAPATGTFTINSADDVTALKTCPVFTGHIVVAADGPSTINLDGLKTVTGNIDIENVAKLKSITSTTLQSVTSLTLYNLPSLTDLTFPALNSFANLEMGNIPALSQCTLSSAAPAGTIQDVFILNTGLKDLSWLVWPVGGQMNITGNPHVTSFSIPYNTINTGSTILISNNTGLNNISLSAVHNMNGALQISENDALRAVHFDQMEAIGGFLQMGGNFSNVSMPALTSIGGGLTVESSEDISAFCKDLDQRSSAKTIKGPYKCKFDDQDSETDITPSALPSRPSKSASATTSGSATQSTATDHAKTDKTTQNGISGGSAQFPRGAIVAIVIALVSIFTVCFAIIFIYLRRRSRNKVREITPSLPSLSPSNSNRSNRTKQYSANSSDGSLYAKAIDLKELDGAHVRIEINSVRGDSETEHATSPSEMWPSQPHSGIQEDHRISELIKEIAANRRSGRSERSDKGMSMGRVASSFYETETVTDDGESESGRGLTAHSAGIGRAVSSYYETDEPSKSHFSWRSSGGSEKHTHLWPHGHQRGKSSSGSGKHLHLWPHGHGHQRGKSDVPRMI